MSDRNPFSAVRRAGTTGPGVPNGIDVKEYLKQEIYKQGQETPYTGQLAPVGLDGGMDVPIPPPTSNTSNNFEDNYILFDTIQATDTSKLGNGELTFNVTTLNNNNPLQNVVSMQINDFYFPRINNSTAFPDYFFYGKMYLNVASSSITTTQAVRAPGGKPYHYELDITNLNSVAVKLVPARDIFYFQKPVQSIPEITFQFTLPPSLSPVTIPRYILTVQGVAGTNPAQFNVIDGNDTSSIGSVGVPTAPGVAVYFQNFNSPNNTLNVAVVSSTGYYVTNILSTTSFEVASLNFATLGVNTNATLIIAKNRIGIEMRFKSLKMQNTTGLVGINL